MSKTKKLNSLSIFLASKRGRQFFHVTYSVGAAIVILGALAKITHLPFGNALLTIGMVVEAFVFFISAFDIDQIDYSDESASTGGAFSVVGASGAVVNSDVAGAATSGSTSGGGVVIAGGGGTGAVGYNIGGATAVAGNGVAGTVGTYNPSNLSPEYIEQMDSAAKGMAEFGGVMTSLNEMSQQLLSSCQQISSSTDNVTGFSANMKALNDNVANINLVYEAQFKSMADQMNTIRYINESLERIRSLYDNTVMDSNAFKMENERMTRQIQELNKVYARLLQAMNAGGNGYNNGGGYNNNNNTDGGYNPSL